MGERLRKTTQERAVAGHDSLGAAVLIAAGTAGYCVQASMAEPIRFEGEFAWDGRVADGVLLDVTKSAGDQPTDPASSGTTISLYLSSSGGGYAGVGYTYRLISAGDVAFQFGSGLAPYGRTTPVYEAGTAFGPGGVDNMTSSWSTVMYRFQGYAYPSALNTNIPADGSTGYLAMRLTIDGGTHYGWLAVRQEIDGPRPMPVITAWGYETEAGVAIAAGVPGPGSLGVLAIGAAGALRSRRRIA